MPSILLIALSLFLFSCSSDDDSSLVSNVIEEGKEAIGFGKGCLIDPTPESLKGVEEAKTQICYSSVAMDESICNSDLYSASVESTVELLDSCPSDPVTSCEQEIKGVPMTVNYYGKVYESQKENLCPKED